MTIIDVVSDKLNKMLIERKWSIYKLSRLTGITPHGIQMILNKEYKDIKMSTLLLISSVFNMSISEFLNDDRFSITNIDINK